MVNTNYIVECQMNCIIFLKWSNNLGTHEFNLFAKFGYGIVRIDNFMQYLMLYILNMIISV